MRCLISSAIIFATLHSSVYGQGLSSVVTESLSKGFSKYKEGDYDGAIVDLNSGIERDATVPQLFIARATVWNEKLEHEKTIADLSHALELRDYEDSPLSESDLLRIYTMRGEARLETNDPIAALSDADKAIASNPKAANAYLLRGKARLVLNEIDSAVHDFSKAVNLDPESPFAYSYRAQAWRAGSNLAKAIEDLSRAIERDPLVAFLSLRADLWVETKQFDNAIVDYTTALQEKSSDAMLYHHRAHAYCSKGDYVSARADFDRAFELDPESLGLNCRMEALWGLNQYDAIVAICTRALEAEPRDYSACVHRGNALMFQGHLDEAIAAFKDGINLSPNNSLCYSYLAWLQATAYDAKYRNAADALRNAVKACEIGNYSSADDLVVLAAAHAEAGDFDEAVSWQQKAMQLNADDTDYVLRQSRKLATYLQEKPYRDYRLHPLARKLGLPAPPPKVTDLPDEVLAGLRMSGIQQQ